MRASQLSAASAPPPTAPQCAAFMALALYLDAVLPDANGVRLPPWFLLSPSYWRAGGGVSKRLRAACWQAVLA